MFIEKKQQEQLDLIPLLKTDAGPRDENWKIRLKEELNSLIKYMKINKDKDLEWFKLRPKDKTGVEWSGSCWYYYDHAKYSFVLNFEIPVTYPQTCPDFILPELTGRTKKMYKDGSICQTLHFKPLWAKKAPNYGIAHALMLGLQTWLAAEIPVLVGRGKLNK